MSLLAQTATAWALIATAFSLVAAWRVRRARARATPGAPGALPSVLLLRPVDAPTPLELDGLRAPVRYGGELEQVIVSPVRPPLPPEIGFVSSDPSTANRKVGHLLSGLAARSTARVVLAVDADVHVSGELVAALALAVQAGAALSYAAPEPLPETGLAARAVRALLVRTHHSFCALDAMGAGPKTVCGKAMGLGPQALALLPRLSEVAGEDLEAAVQLFARGARVERVAVPARVPQGPVDARDALARFARWMQVLRAHRPALFPSVPLLFTPTLPLLALATVAGSTPLWASMLVLLVARATLAWTLLPSRERGEWIWMDWLLGEALLLAAFCRALVTRRLVWRGRTFSVRRGGRLVPT